MDRSDLNRQIVRSSTCELSIPELDLTLPPTSRGQLTTVEGLIRDIVADLSLDQPLRKIQDEESYKKIQTLIDKMTEILGDDEEGSEDKARASESTAPMPQFTVKLDDPAGNSFIEFVGSISDPKWNLRTYHRTLEQNIALGLVNPDDENVRMAAMKQAMANAEGDVTNEPISDEEVFAFPGICSSCGHPITTYMKKVNIPYFKVRQTVQDLRIALIHLTGYPNHVDQL